MRQSFIPVALFSALASSLACGAPKTHSPAMLPVPLVRQAKSYSCGAAALLSVLYYWRAFDGREDDLYAGLDTTPAEGTTPEKIVEVARSFGLTAELRQRLSISDLRAGLALGETVIVELQAWHGDKAPGFRWKDAWEDGHYVVLVGIDAERAYFMDPVAVAGYAYLPLAELPERWHDYESRTGQVVRYHQAAIFIRGTQPLHEMPGPLVRVE
jgi:predicted double-glycine peptidase